MDINWKQIWHFIWDDDSIWSWIVNIILAFILIKFIVYPGLGLLFGTGYPVVAVMSSSMEHHPGDFDAWWEKNSGWYSDNGITLEQFSDFSMRNGFNKGDIIVLFGANPEKMRLGDIIVFASHTQKPKKDPIIHRVVKIKTLQTKGDNNPSSIENKCDSAGCIDEMDIKKQQIIGRAVLKIPYLGYVKIWFVELIKFLGELVK